MSMPTITPEPGDGSVIFYLPLAKETSASIDKYKVGLRLGITNNDSKPIAVLGAFVTFPNDVNKYPIGKYFDIDLGIPIIFEIQVGETKQLGMKGGPNKSGGQEIIKSSPAPSEISITVEFAGYPSPVVVNRPLQPYTSMTRLKGYKFPGKYEDLLGSEYWESPGSHWSGGRQIFAHDLSVIGWNYHFGMYDRIKAKSSSKLNDYFAWEKPVYAMANGEVLGFENDEQDYPSPGQFPPESFYADGRGNRFVIRHGTDRVAYCHMKEGSLNEDLMDVPGDGTENVQEGDLLGWVGNSGHTTAPHLHIEARNINSGGIRPFLFRDIQVISVDALTNIDTYTSWVPVNGKGLPATRAAVWPHPEPLPTSKYIPPDIASKYEAFVRIIFGIIGGGSGLWITPNYKPIPPPPPDPLKAIPSSKMDVLLGVALTELASIASTDESKKIITDAGIKAIENGIMGLKKDRLGK